MALANITNNVLTDSGTTVESLVLASRTLTINGVTYDLTANRDWALSTSNVGEGTNLYYTTARVNTDFDTRLATKSTSNLSEGTNLYYTDARVGTYLTANSYATQTYVNTAVSNLVDAAPGTLDTLNELAAALGDDPNFATTVATSIGTKEPTITAGTTSQYWRGDKSWQTLPIYTLSGLGGQPQLNGTGFVKVSGTTVSYDNSTYYLASNPSGYITGISFANVSAKPTTIAGYGITDSLVYTTSTYSNPSWITALAWSKITGAPAFITGYTETDTLATVTARGASTSTNSIFTGGLQARKNQTDNNYTTAALWTESYGNTTTGIAFHISGVVGKFLEMRTNGILYWENNQVWTSGTLTNLNQLSNGPGYLTSLPSHNHDDRYYTESESDARFAAIAHTHDLGRYSLAAPQNVDGLTSTNFRSTLFGLTSNTWNISTARWNSVPSGLSGMNMYGTMFAWSGSDTHGFIATDYSTANIQVGGGSGNSITWKATLIHSSNIGSYALTSYTETDTLASVTGRGASTTAAITISREATSYGGTTQSFLITGAAGNGALTINSASAYAYLNFAQAGTTKMEIGIVGTAGVRYGSLYINTNIQVGETGASIMVKKSNGFVGINELDPAYQLHITTSNNEGIYLKGSGGGVWMNIQSGSGNLWSIGAQTDGMGVYNRTSSLYTFFIKDNRQLQFSGYTSSSSYSGTAAGYLAFDSSGNIITLASVAATDNTKLPLTGGTMSAGITFSAPGGTILLKHAVSEVDAWIFQENAANWGLYWKNAPTGHHTFGGYTTVGAELFGMSAANSSGNGVTTTNFVGATSAIAQWMISNFTGYIWSASTIYAQTSMVVGGNTVLHAANFSSYATPIRVQSNWADATVINNVVGMLAWKNYGNSHVIFDASQGTSPSGTGVNQTNATTAWAASYPTLMGWNGSGTYGVRVDSARVSDSTTGTASNITAYTINQNLGTGNSPSFAGLTINTGGTGTWGPFVVTSTSQWGDGGTQYVTIGAGGAAGIMINNPHVVWNTSEVAAAVKFGRSGGISSGSYYVIGTGASNNFFINKDGAIASPVLNINSSGNATFSGTISASNLSGTNTGDQTNISGSSSTVTHFASRTDGTAYNVVWAAGNPSHLYSCDAVKIQSSTGTIFATRSSAPMSATVANGNWDASFSSTPVSTMAWGGDISSGGPTGTWWFQMNMRHSNASNIWGTQLAYGWEDNANQLYQRNVTGGNWSGWVRYLNSGNYSSYALPLTGGTLSGTLSFTQPVGLGFANGQYIKDNGAGGLIINSGAAVNIGGTAVTFTGTTYAYNGIQMFRQGQANTGISWYNNTYFNWQEYMASAGATGCGPNANLTAPSGLSQVTSWALRSRMETVSSYGWLWEVGGGGGGVAAGSAVMELDVYGNLRTAADVIAYASDGRLKTNVKVIENAISKVQAIRGVEYDWLENIYEDYGFKPTKMHEVGVIAQEVEAVLPEVVLTAPFNGAYKDKYGIDPNFLTVKYDKMVPLLIEAIKEQQGQIESQKNEIDELKDLVKQLINR